MTVLLIKQSRLVDHLKTEPIRPVFEWFSFQMPGSSLACPDKIVQLSISGVSSDLRLSNCLWLSNSGLSLNPPFDKQDFLEIRWSL
jgi:hypothetical protein